MIKKFWSNLSLYKKMAVFFAEVIVVFVAAAVLINQFIILRSYVELEEKFITNRVLRIEKLISNSVDNLDRICLDWAHWDDSYRFMQDKNQEYLNSNFADPGETLKTLKIDMIIYIDREGKIIYSKFYDSNEDLEKPLPQNLIDSIISGLIPETGPINPDDSGEIKSIKGALPVDDKIMLLSSNSILTSEGPGSPKGMLVMGYFYDDEIEDLSVLTDTQIQFFNLNNEQNYTEFFNIYNEIINKKSVKIIYQKQNHYSGFDVLQDITGNDAILLKASGAREIYLHGKTTVLITASIVSISSAVLSLLTLLALNILFFRRVHNLSLSVKKLVMKKIYRKDWLQKEVMR